MFNVCMIGHGMMGRWHSEALQQRPDCRLHVLVGRRAEPTAAFAREFGYAGWSTDLARTLADPAIDLVVVATPSEAHAANAIAALESGRDTLLEIPMGMDLAEARAVTAAVAASGRKLSLVYPMRMMPDMQALRARIAAGEERVRMVESRFIIRRWENVGATGYRRSWTDNLLWHHLSHLVDFAMWIAGSPALKVWGHLPAADPRTGTPMDATVCVATEADQTLLILGSYAGHESICDSLVLTDRDCYRIDSVGSTLATGAGVKALRPEKDDCAAVLHDFVDAVAADRAPAIPAPSLMPAMAVLQAVQDRWDAAHGTAAIPGRGPRLAR
jgi:2-hydroxy-4-carboxymuconate semialdehyde hemiacetal dehydrogenase